MVMAVSAINYLPPFANSLIMHVLTNAEKLIPLRDAASLAESRRLAGMRMVTGTTSPSTRYERISVSPASCSIKSEYVIASHAFKPQYKCINYTPAWEQRKASEVFQIVDDRGHPTLPVLSATQNQGMIYRDDSGRYIGHDESNEIGYKRVLPGDFVVHLRSFQGGFAHSQYEGITSPAYTVFRAKEPTSHSDRFWKHWFISEHFIAGLSTVTYGIRDGRSISVDEFMNTFLAFPAVEEQAAISRLLDYLDDLITLHQRKRQWLKWLDEGGEGTHHDIDILVFKFADDMKISVLCGVHACMTKSLGHTGNRYAGKQQQRGMGVP